MLSFLHIVLGECMDGALVKHECNGKGICLNDTCKCDYPYTGKFCTECDVGLELSTDGMRCVSVKACMIDADGKSMECGGNGFC